MAQIYVRKDSSSGSSDEANMWDDTELLKAYDRAIDSTKKIIDSRLNGHEQTARPNVPEETWVVGAPCRVVYDVDGIEYEATVESIRDDSCTVRFVGYENVQDVAIAGLSKSHGPETRTIQQYDAETSTRPPEVVGSPVRPRRARKPPRSDGGFDFGEADFPPPPPLPPNVARDDDDGALSAMLMSWYMSGYYTGFYRGSRSAARQDRGRRN